MDDGRWKLGGSGPKMDATLARPHVFAICRLNCRGQGAKLGLGILTSSSLGQCPEKVADRRMAG